MLNKTYDQFEVKANFYDYGNNISLYSTCTLWGLDHFRTFDGTHFNFGGEWAIINHDLSFLISFNIYHQIKSCIYKLASGSTWQINFQAVDCNYMNTCKKVI